uniref:REX1, RNA exonuclease 1 homolog n=1 Tax=Nothobranchius furzeri TaxID=105023 RepID=A0A8C6NYU4_NOTFU
MLRSTGFFRGIDCPFYPDYDDGKGGRNGCNRPYCHFRHCQQRRSSYGAPPDVKKQNELLSGQKGYDPFNPEVVRPQEQQNGKPEASGDLSGALEMVNKAIEEVRSQVEKEKRKLSRIEDEPYSPTERTSLSSSDAAKSKAAGSHLSYDPGSYQITSGGGGYNPTPGCSKYTLESDNQGCNSSSMEYVPTSLKKPLPRTQLHQASSPPSSPKYSNSTPSFKYTVDKSRPSTDMEYDPLSNYSAGIAVKSKRDEGASVKTDYSKTSRPPETRLCDEECVAALKKPLRPSVDTKKYTISDSDGESSGTEYRPMSLSNLQQKKANSWPGRDAFGKDRTGSIQGAPTQRKKEEAAENSDVHESVKQKDNSDKKKGTDQIRHGKSVKPDKVHRTEREATKSSQKSSSSSIGKDKGSIKNSIQVCAKKESKGDGKKAGNKNTSKVKTSDKVQREGRDERRSDVKIKTVEKLKRDLSKPDKEERESKKLKTSDREKEKDSSKESSANSREGVKQKISSSNQNRLHHKRQSVSLSHADLFGDESPDEAGVVEVDYDDEAEEVLVRKSADALKRGRLNKRKASERSPSSSEDEEEDDMEWGQDKVVGVGIDFSSFQDDLDFDSDPMEECLRIFNESKDVKKEDKGRQAKQPPRDSEEERSTDSTLTTLFPGQKKRVSHLVVKGNTDAPSKPVVRPYKRPTPQEMCYQRMQVAQQQAAQLSASVKAASQSASLGGEKKRIAHRPNPQILPSKTSMRSSLTSLRRPIIPSEFGPKVPTNVRQRYLDTFIDECVKFCPSEDEAFQMAVDEEKLVYDRSSSKNIYLNVAVNTLKKRTIIQPHTFIYYLNVQIIASVSKRRPQSHEEVLGGRLAATTSFTSHLSSCVSTLLRCFCLPVGVVLYRKLKSYLMTEEQLQEHGYPRSDPEVSGRAIIHNLPEKKVVPDPFTKICCRCGAEYRISVNGSCVRKEECCYHWGRLRRHKVAGGWETNYSCCASAVGAPGCQSAKQHVQDNRKESLDGFVSTFSKPLPPDGNGGVFALDCEMCYTKQGLELTRVTVINSEMKVIYDTFVKPESKVVDYNTRFSGVTEEDLESATITLRDVQAVLLSMFRAESILIGHSLESDLLALKLLHSSVVDTAIVFPHRLGLPYKRALKNLMADYLKRIIQDNVEGHDSSEDASACMELMIWKIKEDAKVKR